MCKRIPEIRPGFSNAQRPDTRCRGKLKIHYRKPWRRNPCDAAAEASGTGGRQYCPAHLRKGSGPEVSIGARLREEFAPAAEPCARNRQRADDAGDRATKPNVLSVRFMKSPEFREAYAPLRRGHAGAAPPDRQRGMKCNPPSQGCKGAAFRPSQSFTVTPKQPMRLTMGLASAGC